MKFSIITPVFNAADTLEKTLLSVINQDIDADIEYIVVDGGSTDGSLNILNRYSAHIDILVSEKDKGVYDAMNKGVAQATGDIIGIINSDDWYADGALAEVLKTLNQHPKASIFYSPINNYLRGQFYRQFIPGDLDNLPISFVLNHPSCFVKRQVYKTIGCFNLDYSIAADYDFILRAYKAGFEFKYIETPLASYSLDGMSGKALIRFKMLHQSWQVTSSHSKTNSADLEKRRKLFFLSSLFREILTFPIKATLGADRSRQIRSKFTNKLPTFLRPCKEGNHYGIW